LTAAAEEIFGLFERTIAEYEEELRLHTADVQHLLVVKEEVPPEQQEWSSSLDLVDPDPPHIKEEQEELCTSQEGEQLQGLEEADIPFPFTSVPVKSEEDHVEDWGGPDPARNSDPDSPLQPATHDKTSDSSEPETEGSGDWEETEEILQNIEVPGSDVEPLRKHTGVQTDGKPFSCSVCGKRYPLKKSLSIHMRLHSEGKHFTCSVCKTIFCSKSNLVMHMRIHTGEKPFSCSFCSKRFARKTHLRDHLSSHTGEKPFSCSVCSKTFIQKNHLKQHLTVHTGEKPFSCSVCGKTFALKQNLKRHLTVHTGEKPFSCSVCDRSFNRQDSVKNHKCVGVSSGNT
ncbi:gastrula zinc finger protein XlCGF8.2DB, partial [Etheostoma spectabile]|uniref:gastrula zinc finger protein XlCGF8.2DB n=1 Tax=Etheostoma spectabile TaxID=54343 RepID=UPI0013AF254E